MIRKLIGVIIDYEYWSDMTNFETTQGFEISFGHM